MKNCVVSSRRVFCVGRCVSCDGDVNVDGYDLVVVSIHAVEVLGDLSVVF